MNAKLTSSEFAQIAQGIKCPICVRILKLLQREKELCVCEIVDALQVPQYAVSRRLAALSRSKLVVSRRRGKNAYYSLSPHPAPSAQAILEIVEKQVGDPLTDQDMTRLAQRLAKRVDGKCVPAYSERA